MDTAALAVSMAERLESGEGNQYVLIFGLEEARRVKALLLEELERREICATFVARRVIHKDATVWVSVVPDIEEYVNEPLAYSETL